MEGDKILLHAYGLPLTIPKGHVWLAGDNTANSTDSRTYGPVPQALIKGRVFYKLWPPSCVGPIPNTIQAWEKPPEKISRFDLSHRRKLPSPLPPPPPPPPAIDERLSSTLDREEAAAVAVGGGDEVRSIDKQEISSGLASGIAEHGPPGAQEGARGEVGKEGAVAVTAVSERGMMVDGGGVGSQSPAAATVVVVEGQSGGLT